MMLTKISTAVLPTTVVSMPRVVLWQNADQQVGKLLAGWSGSSSDAVNVVYARGQFNEHFWWRVVVRLNNSSLARSAAGRDITLADRAVNQLWIINGQCGGGGRQCRSMLLTLNTAVTAASLALQQQQQQQTVDATAVQRRSLNFAESAPSGNNRTGNRISVTSGVFRVLKHPEIKRKK